MDYILHDYDPNMSVSNLITTTNNGKDYLKWNSSNECDIILVKNRFGENISNKLEALRESMESYFADEEVTKTFVDLNNIAVCIIPRLHNVGTLQRQYPIDERCCRYSIFASRLLDDHTREIYRPMPVSNPFDVTFRDVPMKFTVSIAEEFIERKKGLFGKEIVPSGFYSMSFSKGIDLSGYNNGEVYYTVKDIAIPITRKMIDTGKVFIKTGIIPEVKSKNPGIKVEIV